MSNPTLQPKRYRLLKDLPDGARIGDEYIKGEYRYYNKRMHDEAKGIIESVNWETWQVENNPEWFAPEPLPEQTKEFQPTTAAGLKAKYSMSLGEFMLQTTDMLKESVGVLKKIYELKKLRAERKLAEQKLPTAQPSQAQEKEVLFTTGDGKEIRVGDGYWFVTLDTYKMFEQESAHKEGSGQRTDTKYFSTKELAEAFLTMNKPCLSVNDVIELSEQIQFHNRIHDRADEDYYTVYVSLLKTRLIEIAKSKTPNP